MSVDYHTLFVHVPPGMEERFWTHVQQTPDGCWLWTGNKHSDGYGYFHIKKISKRSYAILAHRFIYQLLHGFLPAGLCVCHHCDTPLCVRPDHLFAGTIQENNEDCRVKGRRRVPDFGVTMRKYPERRARGSKQGSAKLTEEQVLEIRACAAQGTTYRAMAARFHVGKTTISEIVHRHTWIHI